MSSEKKRELVDLVLLELGLKDCANTRVKPWWKGAHEPVVRATGALVLFSALPNILYQLGKPVAFVLDF